MIKNRRSDKANVGGCVPTLNQTRCGLLRVCILHGVAPSSFGSPDCRLAENPNLIVH